MTFNVANLTYAAPYKCFIHPYVTEIPAGLEGVVAFSHDGQNYLMIPCNIKNSVAMGVSPVPPDYIFPGQFQPYSHQKATVEWILKHKNAYVLNGMGSGKTISLLWAANLLMQETKLPTLVVAPLSTLRHTWEKTVFLNFPELRTVILHGGAAKRKKLLEMPADVYLCNPDGIGIIEEELKRVRKFGLICCDESTYFKNARSARFRAMKSVCDAHRQHAKIILMTGSPTAERPTDAYGQVKLADPVRCANMYPYFSNFRDATMNRVAQYIEVPKAKAEEVVKNFMQPAIRFALEDCKDMPERIYITREVKMSKEQYDAYEAMRKHLLAEFKEHTLTAANAGVAAIKLSQIAAGSIYSETGEIAYLPYKDRLDTIVDILNETEKKAIIFCAFTSLVDRLKGDLNNAGFNVVSVDGRVSANERNHIFNTFEKDKHPNVIVAHPKTMAHGLSLLNATTIIWATPSQSAEEVIQAEARNFRLSSTHRCVIVRLCGSGIEEKLWAKIDNKLDMQRAVLDAVAEDSKKYLN